MQTTDIGTLGMLAVYAVLLLPFGLFHGFSLGLNRKLAVAVVRMSVQLTLVGLFLGVIFKWNNPALNVGWVALMMVVANVHTLKSSRVRVRAFFFSSLAAIFAGTLLVVAVFLGLSIRPEPLYDARYLVPITGMVLGNCMRSNIISLERFFSAVRSNRKEVQTYLSLGATRMEAVLPHMRRALAAAVTPFLTTMATMGIVSLPGMMTGQMLGGSFPLVAIKYQIGIMICIFSAVAVTSVLNMAFGVRIAFDGYDNLLPGVLSDD